MKTIAEQDAEFPRCERRCTACHGSTMHHWMLVFPEPAPDSFPEVHLVCRHCDFTITEFDPADPDCPDV